MFTFHYDMFTYDVWGNARDGFDVNDVYPRGAIEIKVKDLEAGPTDRQISRACSARGCDFENDGIFYPIYATSKRNARPEGELRLRSISKKHHSIEPYAGKYNGYNGLNKLVTFDLESDAIQWLKTV